MDLAFSTSTLDFGNEISNYEPVKRGNNSEGIEIIFNDREKKIEIITNSTNKKGCVVPFKGKDNQGNYLELFTRKGKKQIAKEILTRYEKKNGTLSSEEETKLLKKIKKQQTLALAYIACRDYDLINKTSKSLVIMNIMLRATPYKSDKTRNQNRELIDKETKSLLRDNEIKIEYKLNNKLFTKGSIWEKIKIYWNAINAYDYTKRLGPGKNQNEYNRGTLDSSKDVNFINEGAKVTEEIQESLEKQPAPLTEAEENTQFINTLDAELSKSKGSEKVVSKTNESPEEMKLAKEIEKQVEEQEKIEEKIETPQVETDEMQGMHEETTEEVKEEAPSMKELNALINKIEATNRAYEDVVEQRKERRYRKAQNEERQDETPVEAATQIESQKEIPESTPTIKELNDLINEINDLENNYKKIVSERKEKHNGRAKKDRGKKYKPTGHVIDNLRKNANKPNHIERIAHKVSALGVILATSLFITGACAPEQNNNKVVKEKDQIEDLQEKNQDKAKILNKTNVTQESNNNMVEVEVQEPEMVVLNDALMDIMDIGVGSEFDATGKYTSSPNGDGRTGSYEKIEGDKKIDFIEAIHKDGSYTKYDLDDGKDIVDIKRENPDSVVTYHVASESDMDLGFNESTKNNIEQELVKNALMKIKPYLSRETMEFLCNNNLSSKVDINKYSEYMKEISNAMKQYTKDLEKDNGFEL